MAHADEPFPASGHIALATLSVEMKNVQKSLDALTDEVRLERQANVTRNEWEQRNRTVDERLQSIVNDLAARRIPWTSIAAIVIAGAVFLFQTIPTITP